jgi:hypothetical protein
MARTPDPKRHALWRDRIRRQEASGLTVAQFCAQECIARSKLYAWKHRFRVRDTTNPRSTLPAPQAFLPVTVRALERGSEEPFPIEADLPNGIHLQIPTANPRLACLLVRTLAGARTDSGGSR